MSGLTRLARCLVQRPVGTRFINLHEYQSKQLMQRFNIAVQKFQVADTPEGATRAAQELSELIGELRPQGYRNYSSGSVV